MSPGFKPAENFCFSIMALFLATTFIATNIAAFTQPNSYWPEVAFYLTVSLLLYVIAICCGKTRRTTVFARGMLLSIALFGFCQEDEPAYSDADRPLVFNWTINMPRHLDFLDEIRRPVLERGNRIAFGILGGSLALWRYCIVEKRSMNKRS